MSDQTFEDKVFRAGFDRAQRCWDQGLTCEDIRVEAIDGRVAIYRDGVQAWVDLFLGWTATPHAKRARSLGLVITDRE